MSRIAFFADLMGTLFERHALGAPAPSRTPVEELCAALLSAPGEVSGVRLARDILSHYRAMGADERADFFRHLATELDLDADRVIAAATRYRDGGGPSALADLCREAEPRRQELLRRMNQAPGATEELVRMRLDLLRLLPEAPELAAIDADFQHLFSSWFNRGFLVLRHIDWRTPANILEKIIEYEAVHAINDWDDLQRRLRPSDRRCFAFFHPAMPEEPLIFVEVALCKGTPGSVQALLAEGRTPLAAADCDTAVFYSISNCQEGLRGISFGNSLIKQVVEELRRDLPALRRFVTLSPVPGLSRWLVGIAPDRPEAARLLAAGAAADPETMAPEVQTLRRLTAEYLLQARRPDGLPVDPVARFHLGNGALLHEIHALADVSANGFRQSCSAMVNYLYDLSQVETNTEGFLTGKVVAASKKVQSLLAQGSTTGRKS
ncbi:malonyl-CoA decarboxylase domain-containing protein [Cereibacter azotoformans]|uniref:Malonyl-CoA decarboxylase n=1 Tax=Cereibacter sphaeroides (strain ATCC 17025 / ATH 2.4.3) TaxID=349102 RepID=A4WYH2_CERS5|nr:malonyl-CoA decarboxylase family protein [Cereibacter azotoformans]